ncbi:hypothetical protein [Kocuria tytonis]|uniref:Uncharacterized protein n=1 Tax=Kocuria tytonis TaxID=2054280 RepID=A0A495A8D1_9MICC|nr:hypothetical protein [Kocuria tytonis]RKQ36217.1 hypothetical protein C1C97_000580 [Kocuria tytonis]
MKTISSILALLALACLVLAIWSAEHNIRWAITAGLALIVSAGLWGTHLSRVEQTKNAETRLGGTTP